MKHNPFDKRVSEYEAWFIENRTLFQAELLALKQVIPANMKGLEIGVGSGIFAEQLGIKHGLDPSPNMLKYAEKRGITVQQGIAEELPFADGSYDFAVFITSICFIDQPRQSLQETYRILKKQGIVIMAIIDKETPLGRSLQQKKEKSAFYKYAHFFSTKEVIHLLENTGFKIKEIFQTLKEPTNTSSIEKPEKGYGKGSFVVIQAVKNE